MSTYSSIHLSESGGYPGLGSGGLDAAWDCFGEDVRIIVGRSAEYVTPGEALAFAAALIEAADRCARAAFGLEDGDAS